MTRGKGPFRSAKAFAMDPVSDVAIDKATMEMEIEYPEEYFSPLVKDLLQKLFERDPLKRLGTKSHTEIKEHPFFQGKIDFGLLELGRIEAPWKPRFLLLFYI